ncbi:hypothetical protein COT94_02585 [Candidatus Falkowbacteria bacterium CG10_big_fil_rev_8_21_14_0_10_37_14]|uniref:LytR/CpsA/Psr regulator C-terminal domain-containing protein n=1 Tax=Candidatus Falkowbacteria bacterium CG10_big_fil_rev_8_21_14_0_10_37_14 TaxID=1974561 RepID=A0A2M6WTL3_9BACT|nr:MAG: hypothetical protein COT94_02585 [Candidatus Falkowbacteria bacterium CG10_big_fil_rev_8_21_14_0_10_37_14]
MFKVLIHNPKGRRFLRLTSIILGPIIFCAVTLSIWYLWPKSVATINETTVLSQLSKVMVLPDNSAKIELITDINKLQGRFSTYTEQATGNYIITFPIAGKAVLFDARRQTIIALEAVQASSREVLAILELRNGSNDPGRAAAWAKKLSVEYDIVDINQAVKNDYGRNIIVNLKGETANNTAEVLAKKLQAEVINELPSGERSSVADFLVIVGF